MADVGRSVRDLAYLDGNRQPPFRLDRADPADVIVAANGVVDLAPLLAGAPPALGPHTPELLAVAGVPYPDDPAVGCPRWLEFLDWMLGRNAGEVELIRQFTAWVFVARRLKLERVLWSCGPGGNGKSTAMRVLRYVIGDAATSAVGLEAFSGGEHFKLWPALHKLANFACDADVRRKASVAGLNSFVSGDPFTINRKFREQLTVEPTTVCFFASNTAPLLPDASDAWWRRVLLIACNRRPAEGDVDPHLLDRLKAEAPGILNWALAAVPGLLARGRFDIPDSVRANVAALKLQMNAARMFLAEKVEAGSADNDFIARDQLMAVFEGWCRDNGYREDDLSVVKEEVRRTFGAELTRLRRGGPTARGRERVRGWAGVRWRPGEGVEDPHPLSQMVKGQRSELNRQEENLKDYAKYAARLHEEIARKAGTITRLRQQLKKLGVGHEDQHEDRRGDPDLKALTAMDALPAPAPPTSEEEIDALLGKLEDDTDVAGPSGQGVTP